MISALKPRKMRTDFLLHGECHEGLWREIHRSLREISEKQNIRTRITSRTVKTSAEPGRWLKTWGKSEKECLPSSKGRLSPVRQTSRRMTGSSANWEKAQRENWARVARGYDGQNWWKHGLNSSFFQVALLPLLFHIQSWADAWEDQDCWMTVLREKG